MKNYLLLTLLFAGLASCVNKPVGDPVNPESSTEFAKMNVPATFDWKTFTNTVCNIKSDAHISLVSLFVKGATEPMASFYVGKGIEPLKISIPNHINSVVVKYDTEGGQSAGATVSVENGVLAYSVPADSKDYTKEANEANEATEAAVTKADPVIPNRINYPASANGTMGTLLFEDLWPSYGDFDMNDIVVKYLIGVLNRQQPTAKVVTLSLRVAAVGGSQPYEFYLKLSGVNGANIESVKVINKNNNTVTDPTVTQIYPTETTQGTAVFKFNNILKNKNATPTVPFFNTSKNNEVEWGNLVDVSYTITLKEAVSINELTLDKFDFFIAKADSKEIHMSGYAPTSNGTTLYETLKAGSSLTAAATDYYKSTSNLVWAFNVTSDIAHAYEKVDFLKAYPEFKIWAESNGTTAKEWFNNPVSENVNAKSVIIK